MELSITQLIEELFLPPGLFFILFGIALILLFLNNRNARRMALGVFILWYVTSTPIFSSAIQYWVESYPALTKAELSQIEADAIILLSAGHYGYAPEYNGSTVSKLALERIRYAAYLQKLTKLPIIISGGVVGSSQEKSYAIMMREVLQNEFNVPVAYLESSSKSTYENAKYTSQIARNNNIAVAYLVTHSIHMPRSVEAFKFFELDVIPAPTVLSDWRKRKLGISDILPQSRAQFETAMALHEIVGRLWYKIRYY